MRIVSLTAATAGLIILAGAAPALAQDETLIARSCGMTITNRVASGGRRCTEMILRKDVGASRTDFIFAFPDGFKLEISGPALSLSADASIVTPDRITWANPGQTTPSTEANTAGQSPIRGRCVTRTHRKSPLFGSLSCRLSSSLGRIDVEFVTPKPEQTGD